MLELLAELAQEGAVGPQAGDLVLVLDGHQLEQAAGHRLGKVGAAGHAAGLGVADPGDAPGVAAGVGRVLVGGQEFGAVGDGLVQVCAQPARGRRSWPRRQPGRGRRGGPRGRRDG